MRKNIEHEFSEAKLTVTAAIDYAPKLRERGFKEDMSQVLKTLHSLRNEIIKLEKENNNLKKRVEDCELAPLLNNPAQHESEGR